MLSEAIDRANERHDYHLVAFVYMPERVHLLVFPGPTVSGVDRLLRAIKRPYSFRIKQLLAEIDTVLLRRLTIQQRPGVSTFRYWQEGPGYDRNLDNAETVLTAIDYLHRNPVRRGLVERAIDWQWSSARWYQGLAYDRNIRLPELEKLPAGFWRRRHHDGRGSTAGQAGSRTLIDGGIYACQLGLRLAKKASMPSRISAVSQASANAVAV
jgi:REP-associated tyrosine transposase